MSGGSRPRVLFLAQEFPSATIPTRGLWTLRLARAAARHAEPVVIAPVPRALRWLPVPRLQRFADEPLEAELDGIAVHHPRVPTGYLHQLQALDARLMLPAVRALARRLHRARPFSLLHAHFIYPDGVVAAALGAELGLPVITTEHAFWDPWLVRAPAVRRQVLAALPGIRMVTAVSEAVRRQVVALAPAGTRTAILPNVVDDALFRPAADAAPPDGERVLFVGVIRRVKGLDVLVEAMALLAARRPHATLTVVGGGLLHSYAADEAEVRALVAARGLASRVHFTGTATPADVAALMRASSVLVVPSRRETFSSVAAEALACGLPVVATRCGGPEDFVDAAVGAIVDPGQPAALADAIDDVLSRRASLAPEALRARVVGRFGMDAVAARLAALYAEAAPGR